MNGRVLTLGSVARATINARALVTGVLAGLGHLIASVWRLATFLPASTVLIIGTVVLLVSGTANNPGQTGSDTSLAQIAEQTIGDSPRMTADRATLTELTAVRPANPATSIELPDDAIELRMRTLTVDGVDLRTDDRGVRHAYPLTAGGPKSWVTVVVVINSLDLCLSPALIDQSVSRATLTTRRHVQAMASATYSRYDNLPAGREGLCIAADEVVPILELITSGGQSLSIEAVNLDLVLYRLDVATATSKQQNPRQT